MLITERRANCLARVLHAETSKMKLRRANLVRASASADANRFIQMKRVARVEVAVMRRLTHRNDMAVLKSPKRTLYPCPRRACFPRLRDPLDPCRFG